MTDYVCHTAPVENAVNISKCGSLQVPVKWRGVSASGLNAEDRNAANDPEDYLDYVMFAWGGNCQAGDRLVMERKNEAFFYRGRLKCGFHSGSKVLFKYDKIVTHPNATFEGVLPLKIKEEVMLSDWVDIIIIPSAEREAFEAIIPYELESRTFYLDNDCKDIRSWSEKVYEFVKGREQ